MVRRLEELERDRDDQRTEANASIPAVSVRGGVRKDLSAAPTRSDPPVAAA